MLQQLILKRLQYLCLLNPLIQHLGSDFADRPLSVTHSGRCARGGVGTPPRRARPQRPSHVLEGQAADAEALPAQVGVLAEERRDLQSEVLQVDPARVGLHFAEVERSAKSGIPGFPEGARGQARLGRLCRLRRLRRPSGGAARVRPRFRGGVGTPPRRARPPYPSSRSKISSMCEKLFSGRQSASRFAAESRAVIVVSVLVQRIPSFLRCAPAPRPFGRRGSRPTFGFACRRSAGRIE